MECKMNDFGDKCVECDKIDTIQSKSDNLPKDNNTQPSSKDKEEIEDERKYLKIFVGGLPFSSDDFALYNHFSVYGPIVEAVIIRDRTSGLSKGYGFVTMQTKESAALAVSDPAPIIDGRRCNVNYAFIGAKAKKKSGEQYHSKYYSNRNYYRNDYFPPNNAYIAATYANMDYRPESYNGYINPIVYPAVNYVYYTPRDFYCPRKVYPFIYPVQIPVNTIPYNLNYNPTDFYYNYEPSYKSVDPYYLKNDDSLNEDFSNKINLHKCDQNCKDPKHKNPEEIQFDDVVDQNQE